jgi:hypothetical protein
MSYGPRERAVLKQFEGDIANHEMTVIRDEGNYRHLRFSPPGSYIMGFDVITWPGYLAYVGDMGDYVFSRTEDMLTFFRREDDYPIDFRYWAEKLQGPGGGQDLAREYSVAVLKQKVEAWVKEYADSHELSGVQALELREAADEQVLDREMVEYSETFAHYYIREFEHAGISMESLAEELDLKVYEFRFLWCCFALVWAIEQYDKAKGRT